LLRIVTNLNDSGPGSLRDAIALANSGDVIVFGVTGTITLTSGELQITKDLTINGPGPSLLAISGNLAGRVIHICAAGPFGCLDVQDINTGPSISISAVTIRDGDAHFSHSQGMDGVGGGILVLGSLSLANCIVTNNIADSSPGFFHGLLSSFPVGGGISLGTARPGDFLHATIVDSTISGNSAFWGGGIYVGGGSLTITNSTISGNSVLTPFEEPQLDLAYGGGIYNVGSLTVLNSTITGNSSDVSAGGIGINLAILLWGWQL
jgi:hypothetical protein